MRIMRWICSYTRQDRIRNTVIREKVGVAPIVEKMVKLLSWMIWTYVGKTYSRAVRKVGQWKIV